VEYEDDLDQDVEAAPSAPEVPSLDSAKLQKELERARKEAQGLRVQLRRSEMASEYGTDVLDYVPDDLPIERQKELAAKLAERFRSTTTVTDEASDVAEVTPEVPTPAEQRLAAVSGAPVGGTPQGTVISALDWMRLREENPTEADRILRGGGVSGVKPS
jgi:hypothetical protein